MSNVAAYLCANYDDNEVLSAVTRAVNAAGGLDWVTPGMRVAVKVNLLNGSKPEDAVTTHPAVACAVVKLLRDKGADVVVGDSPSGAMSAARLNSVYNACGMRRVEEFGAALNYDLGQKEMHFNGKSLSEFQCCSFVADADAIINVCKLKTHGMMGMTAAVKNMYGVIPGITKAEYHFRHRGDENFADMLVDLNECFKPRMHIVDAVVAMEGNGPSNGHPRHVGLIAASTSPYALDEFCAGVIGIDPKTVPTMAAAAKRGLSPAELTVIGDGADVRVEDFELIEERRSVLFGGEKGFARLRGQVMQNVLGARPVVLKDDCIGCGKCAQVCPAKAISIKNKLPVIKRSACIYCFCCQELCPKGAMRVTRTALARLLGKI